jgi:formylglycine-generating enzyme required for sulfatase activity
VTCVSFADAVRSCEFLGRRLPREAEWIHAARLRTKRRYPWGDEPPSCERVAGLIRWRKGGTATDPCPGEAPDPPATEGDALSPPLRLAPVCAHPAGNSSNGICDLAGNAGEWVDAVPVNRRPLERLVKGASPLGAEPDFIELDARAWLLAPANPVVGFRCVGAAPAH